MSGILDGKYLKNSSIQRQLKHAFEKEVLKNLPIVSHCATDIKQVHSSSSGKPTGKWILP